MSIKSVAFRSLRALGAFDLIARTRWRSQRLLILCYHGISLTDEHEWNPHLYMRLAMFRDRLERLRRLRCQVLPLREGLDRLRGGTLPPRTVALTFDDGTTDFRTLAVPALQEFGMPATVYLTTYYSQHRFPVFDMALSYLLWKGRRRRADLAPVIGATAPVRAGTARERHRAWTAVREVAETRHLDGRQKDVLLREVARAADVDYDACFGRGSLFIMSPDDVRALPRDLIRVSLHTHRHRTPRDRAAFGREVTDNAAAIHGMLGRDAEVDAFCYPSGDYWGEFPGWLAELGVRSATTCVFDLAAPSSNPFLLPRVLDDALTPDVVFEGWLSGLAALLPKRRALQYDPNRLRTRGAEDGGAIPPAPAGPPAPRR